LSRNSARSAASIISVLAFAGCAGDNATRGSLAAPEPALAVRTTISLSPPKLSFGLGFSRKSEVTVTGGTPPYSVKQSNDDVADVTSPQKDGTRWTFFIAPVAAGDSKVTVADSSGAHSSISVSQETCAPPTPEFGEIYPQAGAKGVPATVGVVYMAEPSSDQLRPYVHEFYARLIGSDGSVINGSHFAVTKVAPPAGAATLPAGSVYVRAQVPRLRGNMEYRVSFPTSKQPCIPSQSTGSFATK